MNEKRLLQLAILGLEGEQARINAELTVLQERLNLPAMPVIVPVATVRRTMSLTQRRRLSRAMKASHGRRHGAR